MEGTNTVIKKELRYLLHRRKHLGIVGIFILAFLVISSLELKELGPLFIGPVVLFVTLWTFLMLTLKSEQVNNTVNFLMASPLSFREVFFGKIAPTFILAYSAELFSFGVGSAVLWFSSAKLLAPSMNLLVLIVIPIWTWVIAELLALSYMLFGSPLIAQVFGVAFMMLFINFSTVASVDFLVSSPTLLSFLGLAVIVLSYYLLGRLDREWVVKRWKHSGS
ncbi:MAG: hypothetical protein ABEJ25_02645 [Candidatus Bipolaricaulia bacterium]